MPIVRGEHNFDSHFTQVPNAWLRDKRLSYKARGLLAELMSHSIGFEVSIKRLALTGVDGRDSISSAIFELESFGYLQREQLRNSDGTLSHTLWTTKDPETPWTGFPATAEPTTDNQHLKKNNKKNTETKNSYAYYFDLFWSNYPRKVGKGAAEKAFAILLSHSNLPPDEIGEIIADGARRLAQDPNLPPAQFIPHPSTWLNRLGWEDEPYPEREKTEQELEAQRLERLAKEREKTRMESLKRLEQQERDKARSTPPPKCVHGLTIVQCKLCLKKQHQ
jgi:hypothetical protein